MPLTGQLHPVTGSSLHAEQDKQGKQDKQNLSPPTAVPLQPLQRRNNLNILVIESSIARETLRCLDVAIIGSHGRYPRALYFSSVIDY